MKYYKRIVNTFFVIVVCMLILLPVLYVIGGISAIAFEGKLTAKRLNNPFINADYQGWHTVESINGEQFMLPKEWSLTTTGATAVINDENSKTVARGGVLTWKEYNSRQYDDLLSKLFGFQVSVDTITPEKNVRSSVYGTIKFTDKSSKECDYILLYSSDSSPVLFTFNPTAHEMSNDISNILEAIIFSYVFK